MSWVECSQILKISDFSKFTRVHLNRLLTGFIVTYLLYSFCAFCGEKIKSI